MTMRVRITVGSGDVHVVGEARADIAVDGARVVTHDGDGTRIERRLG